MIEIALYQPDIAPNAATIIRMAACLGLRVRIIEPAGFVWTDSGFRRAAMDYLGQADVVRERSWLDFLGSVEGRRIVLLTTKAEISHVGFSFAGDDIILLGRESAGVPDEVHARAEARIRIPMRKGLRSLNVAMACALVTGEALRQLGGFPA